MTDDQAQDKVRGRFWLPEAEATVGTLHGTSLVLDGMLPDGPKPETPPGQVVDQTMIGRVEVPVVHGELANGPFVTIVD